MLGKNLLEYNTETIDGYEGSRIYHSGDAVSDVYESTGQRYFYKGDTATNLRGDVASESIDDFMSRRGLPSASVAFDNANKVETLASEYDTGAKSAELADGGEPVLGTREAKRNVVVDSLLRDENHPDPAKAEFNRRWNEQVRKNSSAPTNRADPFGGMSDSAIEADIYNEVKDTALDEPIKASKPKAPRKPKPGDFLIDAEGRTTVVPPEPLNAPIKYGDLTKSAKATEAAAPTITASIEGVAETVASGGAVRAEAAITHSGSAASKASHTAAAVTAPTAARSTRSLMDNALEVGQKITRGHLGATALGVAAAGLLFGYANRDDN